MVTVENEKVLGSEMKNLEDRSLYVARDPPVLSLLNDRRRKIMDAINGGERLMRPYRIDTSNLYRETEVFRRLLKKHLSLFKCSKGFLLMLQLHYRTGVSIFVEITVV
jgi:hypothetical protein